MRDDLEVCRADVVDDVLQEFIAYEAALIRGDASSLNEFFWNDEAVVRFGVADRQRGYHELEQWRATQRPLAGRQLADTQVTTFGADLAVITTLFFYPERECEGRQSQTWVRGLAGWRIVAAHVSEIPNPTAANDCTAAEEGLKVNDRQLLAVVGAHLRGQPLNYQLAERGANFVEQTTTSGEYRLYSIRGEPAKPALVRDAHGAGRSVEVELWSLANAEFALFVAAVQPPLAIGPVELCDGRRVPGFLGQPAALESAVEITGFGGWRAYVESLESAPPLG